MALGIVLIAVCAGPATLLGVLCAMYGQDTRLVLEPILVQGRGGYFVGACFCRTLLMTT